MFQFEQFIDNFYTYSNWLFFAFAQFKLNLLFGFEGLLRISQTGVMHKDVFIVFR